MAKLPYIQFFPGDWVKDTRALSLSTKGAWIDIICAMWSARERGVLCMSLSAYGRIIGTTEERTGQIIEEIQEHDVCEVEKHPDGKITLRSRRIIREALEWQQKSEANRKGAEARWGKKDANAMRTQCERNATSDSILQTSDSREREEARAPEVDVHIPTFDEVKEYAAMHAVTFSTAKAFYDHHEGKNLWFNKHQKLINWRHSLIVWRDQDRANGGTRNENRNTTGRTGPDRNAGTANAGKAGQYAGVGKLAGS